MSLASYLPLTETTYYILLSLAPGPRHGYAIIKNCTRLSENRLVMSTGTLYGALKRLLDAGWIERSEDPQPNPTERERKTYSLTELGRQILNAEVDRLRSLLLAADRQENFA